MTGVPASLATIVARLLEKLPADRFQTAAETRAALESCLDLTRTPIPGASLVPVPVRSALAAAATLPPQPAPRRRRYWPVAAIAACAMATGVVIWMANDTSTPAPVIAPAQTRVVTPPPHVDPPKPVETPKPIVSDPVVADPKPPVDPKGHHPPPRQRPVAKASAAPPLPVELKTVPAETPPPPAPTPTPPPPPPAKTDLPF